MKAKEFIPANKPRNFVAKNAMKTTSGAGAHKDKKKAEKQGNVKHKKDLMPMERYRDPEDWDEGNTEPPNNFAVYINGKKWKVFQGRGTYADDAREMQQYYKLQDWARKKSQQTGKKWEVYRTGEAATESIDEGWKEKLAAAGLAGAIAMGASGPAQARVGVDDTGAQAPSIAQQMKVDQKASDSKMSLKFDNRYEGSPEAGVIKVDGKLYKFAGRTADAPGNGEKIKVPAGSAGIRGIAPITVELGSDGMYYLAGSK